MALVPRGVGAPVGRGDGREGKKVPSAGIPGGGPAGRWGVAGPVELAPPRALEAAGLGERRSVCGAERPPPGSHSPDWAAGCPPKGRGPGARGPAGAGPRAGGAEESPGRKAEPRWDGPTRRGREAASRGPPS